MSELSSTQEDQSTQEIEDTIIDEIFEDVEGGSGEISP